ncbi:MAG: hypothetical protein L6R39_001062 [Caloplaca ligustica]|nr:MAG: hypothetical protein L6R39_001062 [Caloplaca ligustica]
MDETCCAVSNPPRSLQYALVRRAMQSFQRPNQRTLRSLCNTWQSHITGKTRRPLAQWEAVEVDEVARIDRNLYLDPPDTSKSLGTTSCGIASSMRTVLAVGDDDLRRDEHFLQDRNDPESPFSSFFQSVDASV